MVSMVSWFHVLCGFIGFVVSIVSWCQISRCQWFNRFIGVVVSVVSSFRVIGFVVSMVSWFHGFRGVKGFMVSWCQWFCGFLGFLVSMVS